MIKKTVLAFKIISMLLILTGIAFFLKDFFFEGDYARFFVGSSLLLSGGALFKLSFEFKE